MEQSKLEALAREVAKDIKTQEDLGQFSSQLMKMAVEAALGAEMEEHLGYSSGERSTTRRSNHRNGSSKKRLIGEHGEVEITTPRDREGSFEPKIVGKRQTRLTQFDDQILTLYAKGMSTRDIVATFQEMYGAEVSPTLISKVTDAVHEQVVDWQNRPLDSIYPILYLDCIVLKIRQDNRVLRKSVYLALGINLEGQKELLGLWISETEGAKFWLSVLTELQNRGVQDILIACVDGLSGFPDAIEAVYPKAQVQLCIVHMVRSSVRYVPYKEKKAVCADLKKIYGATTDEQATLELERFSERWDESYPNISKSWRKHWENIIPFFDYPEEIRKVIYTTNAIESLNSVIRKSTKNRKVFPNDKAATKVVYLAIREASKKWTMPIRNWKPAMNRFMIEFEDRLQDHI